MLGMEFDLLLEERIAKMRAVLKGKAAEYASPKDRLYNFKRASEYRIGSSAASALLGMLVKHWVSIETIVVDDQHAMLDLPTVNEKIGDAVNYLVLLEAVLIERIKGREKRHAEGKVAEGEVYVSELSSRMEDRADQIEGHAQREERANRRLSRSGQPGEPEYPGDL